MASQTRSPSTYNSINEDHTTHEHMSLTIDDANTATKDLSKITSSAPDITDAQAPSAGTISPTPSLAAQHSRDPSQFLASTSSSVTFRSQTPTSPARKISIREYTLWKASDITPYSAYLVWKEDHTAIQPPVLIKLSDQPHVRERLEEAEEIVREELEKQMEIVMMSGDELWGTQFV